MFGARYGIVAGAAAVVVLALSTVADATPRRCGFDRYGYHPPDFRGCYPSVEVVEVPAPVVVVERVRRVKRAAPRVHRVNRAKKVARVRKVVAIAPPPPPPPPFEGYYAAEPVRPGCYLDNGYDMLVHRVCYTGW